MESDLIIKKRLIDLLNKSEEIKLTNLLSEENYKENEKIENKLKENNGDANCFNENDEKSIERIKKEERGIYNLLKILEGDKIIVINNFIGYKKIKSSLSYGDFKSGFYVKLILKSAISSNNQICHKNNNLGKIDDSDLDVFYEQGRMLIREGLIKGSNQTPFKNGLRNALINPEVLVNSKISERIVKTNELNIISQIKHEMSDNQNVQNIQNNYEIFGDGNSMLVGNNNTQTITTNEEQLIKSLVSSTNNKEPLWSRLLRLIVDLGDNGNLILQAMVPFLAMIK